MQNPGSCRLSQAALLWAPVRPVPCPPPCRWRSPRAAQQPTPGGGWEQVWGGSGWDCPGSRAPPDVGCALLTHRRGTKWSRVSWVVVRIAGEDACDGASGVGTGPRVLWVPGCSGLGWAGHRRTWESQGCTSGSGAHRQGAAPSSSSHGLGGGGCFLASLSLSSALHTAADWVPPRVKAEPCLGVLPPDALRGGSSPKRENRAWGSRIWAQGPPAPRSLCPPPFPDCTGGTPESSCSVPGVPEQGWLPASRPRSRAHLGLGPCRQ